MITTREDAQRLILDFEQAVGDCVVEPTGAAFTNAQLTRRALLEAFEQLLAVVQPSTSGPPSDPSCGGPPRAGSRYMPTSP